MFKKLQLIQLKENDTKTFSPQNFNCFTGKECLRFLRSWFYQKLLAVLEQSSVWKQDYNWQEQINFSMYMN